MRVCYCQSRQFKVENVRIDRKKVLSVMCICSVGQYAQKSRPVVPKVSYSPWHAKVSFEHVVMCTGHTHTINNLASVTVDRTFMIDT